jgi:hypothetical protein
MKLPLFVFIAPQKVKLIENYPLPYGGFIPKGFESDLGSIPPYFWWFLTPYDVKYSSIIHDYEWLQADFGLYEYGKSNKNFFFNCIAMDKIPRWKAIISFIALEIVKIFKLIFG